MIHIFINSKGKIKRKLLLIIASYSYPRILQKVSVPVISPEQCAAYYVNVARPILESHICIGFKNGSYGACYGDSGGPVVRKVDGLYYELLGLVSWSYGCARANYPAVNTRIPLYLNFLNASINQVQNIGGNVLLNCIKKLVIII